MNIANWLDQTARLQPQAPALYMGNSLHASYGQFAARAAALGRWMAQAYGVQPGERIALFMPNRCEYLEIAYAAWWLGAVVVPINYKLHPREAAWIASHAQARLLFADESTALAGSDSSEQDMPPPLCIAVDGPEYRQIVQAAGDAPPGPEHAPHTLPGQALAWLFYTSGTTGRPKGVMLSHDNLVAMSLCYPTDVDAIDHRDALLYAAPMSHGAGLYNFIFVRHAARHIVPASRGFDAGEILALARAHGALSLFAAPTMVNRLVAHASEHGETGAGLKTVVYGGGPMYLADLERALQVLGPCLAQIYGQGETPMTITALPKSIVADGAHEHAAARRSSVGVPHACVQVRVSDAATWGADGAQSDPPALSTGQTGEVLVRGATVMQGYWRNPQASAQALQNGWLRTGDIGRFDADGFLTLTDRSKDVIISGGSNIYPREVEEVLLRHASVAEVSVIGCHSAEWGEEVAAMVVPQLGAPLQPAELDRWCRASLAAFKAPKRYYLCEALPKNSYGKVLKTQLREQLPSLQPMDWL
ncbi:AMP-dependent synthetase [Vandammella animalimorsus]|uniref:AMP-dependent synthetase n=1 Tax=Vandammella animalimorsus TaxID=2029117 RepID=A0A2A2ATD7_9BURK|nr:AMP-binding protein [Vandammella animalimorsus]PAT41116.1 AMP-dependent synthetase [Vandammella animalimorsus]